MKTASHRGGAQATPSPDNAADIAPFHRGRVQAQGGGLEKSEAWSRETPPTRSEGHGYLDQLCSKLTQRQIKERVEAFREAHKYIDKSAKCGGIDAIIKKSFPQPSLQGGKRVDIEVLMGKAFIPDLQVAKKGL